MLKNELRKIYLQKMKLLSSAERDEKSANIAQLFFENFMINHEFIHVFLSIEKNNEVNISYVLKPIFQKHRNVVVGVSKSNFSDGTMKHYKYESTTKLVLNKWGIPEPEDAEEISPDKFDMVLVPLLCFDKQGYRVGYGKGFYDKFLAQCKPTVKKIGLSLFAPVDEITDIHAQDIKLNACITPCKIFYFD